MKRGNGFGSIFKLSGKRRNPWAIRVTVGWTNEGKQVYKYVSYHPTKTEAKRALDAFNSNPYDLTKKDTTLADVYEMWIKNNPLGESITSTYKSAYRHASRLHEQPIRGIKLMEHEFVMGQLTPSMQQAYKNIMGHLYKYAMKHEIVDKNPIEFLEPAKPAARKQKNIFSPAEIQKLWDLLSVYEYADVPLILLHTGMRINELLMLKRDKVFLDDGYMIAGSKTAAGKNRTIPIHDAIFPLVKKRMDAGNMFLITNNGGPYTYNGFARYQWANLMEVIGAQHTIHETRHTFVSYMDRSGANAIAVKKIVGHAPSNITEHYTHKSLDELRETINMLRYA